MSGAIAVVGMGLQFPGAQGSEEAFWELVRSAQTAIREVPKERWVISQERALGQGDELVDQLRSLRAGVLDDEPWPQDLRAHLEKLGEWDWLNRADILYKTSLIALWRALANAGLKEGLGPRCGLTFGNIVLPTDGASRLSEAIIGPAIAAELGLDKEDWPEVETRDRAAPGLPATLLARVIGAEGGARTLDAACASSLYALKFAADELRARRADLMIAGGVSRASSLYTQMGFSQLRALSRQGRCAPFEAGGDGLVVGEGAGFFVLRRLEDAIARGDRIRAVLRGFGLSNDRAGSLLAPDSEGQLRAMRAAYDEAGWEPSSVDLIECHATGTPLGDAVEYRSLRQLWSGMTRPAGRAKAVIGSVKSNLGHLLTGAGAAGLAKVILALEQETLPPTANFRSPGEALESYENGPLQVLSEAQPWSAAENHPRRAAVSAFGFGGINAHVLVEAPSGLTSDASEINGPTEVLLRDDPIAFVGMDASFAGSETLEALRHRIFQGDLPEPKPLARGAFSKRAESLWRARQTSPRGPLRGYAFESIEVPLGRYRIPPVELTESLAQQTLMLRCAAEAWERAGLKSLSADDRLRVGVFIGLGLDLHTGDFQLRWSLAERAEDWARRLGHHDPAAFRARILEKLGPALSATRTVGALGGIVASRIARELNLGGPSLTISAEQASGLRALEIAVRQLQRGELQAALVGAVDLAADLRAALSADVENAWSREHGARPWSRAASGAIPGEGALALVLMRESEARRRGLPVLGLLRGLGVGSATSLEAQKKVAEQAWREAGCASIDADLIEGTAPGSAQDAEIEAQLLSWFAAQRSFGFCSPGAIAPITGETGAATGLSLLLKALLQLDARVLAPLAGRGRLRRSLASPRLRVLESARPWLRDRIDGPRRAAVHHISPDGATTHLVLEEAADQRPAVSVLPAPPALFLLRGDSEASLSRRIDALDASLQSRGEPLTQLARSFRDGGEGRFGLALWGRNKSELREHLAQIRAQIGRVDQLQRDGLRYSARALAQSGELAFVYPGSGNQRLQMGRSLLLAWPQLERRQDQENERLESQLCSDWLWAESEAPAGWEAKHRELILAQVTLGTLATDWLRLFLPDPKSILGYSLGESAALFGMRLWPARDEMLRRVLATPLFTSQLSGDFEAVKAAWKLAPGERVDWRVGIVPVPATRVREAIASRARVYLLIINTPGECVIGGDAAAVDALLRELGCVLLPLEGITSVHCEVLAPVAEAYENLHRLPTRPQPGIKVYSGARGESYELSEESAARAILEQALYGIDFPKLIESAYAEGSRIFVEVGPGNSCTRMIRRILGDRPACTVAALPPDSDPDDSLCALLASLHAEGLSVRLEALDARAEVLERTPRVLKVSNAWPIAEDQDWSELRQPRQAPEPAARPLAPALAPAPAKSLPRPSQPAPAPLRPATSTALLAPSRHSSARSLAELQAPVEGALRLAEARASAHEAFMSLAQQTEARLAAALSWQMSLYAQAGQEGVTLSSPPVQAAPELASRPAQAHQESADLVRFSARPSQLKNPALRLDFEACLEFARGQVGPVLGPDFAGADAFPTRVRLPDEPLQLVHGIRLIEGEARSMTKGRVVTEHEIRENAWYLDDGHIPTCIAVEAGQADLFLSGYLGIDFETRGLACYRLLDAIVSFHRALPGPGSVIVYDIHIDGFFRQGATWLFRFRFEGTVDGEPLLSMREGCAGFFSEAELAAGKGIIKTRLDLQKRPGKVGPGWRWLAPPIQAPETLSAEGITALQSGDLGAAFGPAFAALPLKNPLRLPGRRFEGDLMRLLDRVTHIDSRGGRFGLGVLEAEFDIHPDDWFLTCHFVDDQVMPGTLMYECCMHALRVWLMRMGWVFEDGEASTEPLPGVSSRLKCRGQVVATTRIAGYEITIKELGLEPMPYVIADALMFADGKPIVEITDMSLRLKGMSAARLEEIWSSAPALPALASKKPAIFGPEKIRAFSLGKPSEAFGAPYKIFDEGRIIARLPGPPYEFLHRITRIEGCEAFVMSAGGDIDAEFDCSPNDWYFAANRGSGMPFAVLLEVALQPCGWLAGYVGSALTSEVDLSFRNLGGKARQLREVNPQGGPLCTRVKMTAASRSGGMIIQHFEMDLRQDGEPVYQGTTYFGFFTKDALSQQVGIRGANIYQPDAAELARSLPPRDYPREAPFPADQLRMLDQVVLQIPDGGPAGLGFLRGTKKVREDDWFFKAHFYQDPVCPGSLGLESFLQLLMLQAAERWSNRILLEKMRFQAMALGQEHEWVYRGQVIPRDKLVTVQAAITAIDDDTLQIEAAGHLSVDGRIIYGMERFAIRVWESPE